MTAYPNNKTDDLIRDFQDGGPDAPIPPEAWDGKLLTPDGVLGPRTEWALHLADLPRLRREVARIAIGELGEKETAPNDSARIRVYKAPLDGKPGEAWCAYGVSYVLREARVPGAIYTASARTCLHQFPLTTDPEVCDLAGWVNPDGTGHVFFVFGFAVNPGGSSLPLDVIGLEFNSANMVRLTQRPRGGLLFSQLPTPAWRGLVADKAIPRVLRDNASTR
jgi:hypothetical protein